jgi:hypothetical protein
MMPRHLLLRPQEGLEEGGRAEGKAIAEEAIGLLQARLVERDFQRFVEPRCVGSLAWGRAGLDWRRERGGRAGEGEGEGRPAEKNSAEQLVAVADLDRIPKNVMNRTAAVFCGQLHLQE